MTSLAVAVLPITPLLLADCSHDFSLLLQFYRNFPGPSEVSQEEMKLVVDKYCDPLRPGMMNYLNLHHDILAVTDFMAKEEQVPTIPQFNIDCIPLQVGGSPLLICCKLVVL